MAKKNLSYKRTLVQGLMAECPLNNSHKDCPAKSIRHLPLEVRLKLVETMGESEIDLIMSHHQYCFQKSRWELLYEQEEIQKEKSCNIPNYRAPQEHHTEKRKDFRPFLAHTPCLV